MSTTIRTCIHCRQTLDISKEDYAYAGTRYFHINCREKFCKSKKREFDAELYKAGETPQFHPRKPKEEIAETKVEIKEKAKKKNLKKCFYCSRDIDIENEEYGKPRVNRYAHIDCYRANFQPDEAYVDKIYDYLKEVIGSYDYTQCEKQRINYVSKLGYTNEDILLTLKYMYGVKRMSSAKAGGRIGLVPYIYDEAMEYYEKLNKKKLVMGAAIEKQLKKEHKIIEIKVAEKPVSKGYIDLDSVGGD